LQGITDPERAFTAATMEGEIDLADNCAAPLSAEEECGVTAVGFFSPHVQAMPDNVNR
jgi:hypothetical protein